MEYAEDFDKNYLPRKLPTNHTFGDHRHFELMCYTRWFVIKKFMEERKLQRAFSADADTMIYVNVTEYLHRYHAEDELILTWNYPLVR